jgi:tetratricopeptide (TPR) repeat protein
MREFRIAAEDMPGDPAVHYNIAEVYAAMGHYQAASTEYEYAIRLNPEFIEAHTALGKLMMDAGQYASAESHFYEALALNPSHAETQLHMGWLYVKIGKYNEASHYFFRGLRKSPGSSYGHLGLAMSYQLRENYEDALAEYHKVYRIDEKNADALLGIGQCQLQLGRETQAETALKRSIEARPDNPLAYNALGNLYLKSEQYAEAIANYRMAIVQQEDLAVAHLGLGQALEATGQLPEAEDALQRALYHDPENALVLYRLGQVYVQMFNEERARSYFEMAMEKAVSDFELESKIRSALSSLSENDGTR